MQHNNNSQKGFNNANNKLPTITYSVADFNKHINTTLLAAQPQNFWVVGQIMNINFTNDSFYASLRDENINVNARVNLCAYKSNIFTKYNFDNSNIKEGDLVSIYGTTYFNVKKSILSIRAINIKQLGDGGLLQKIEEIKKRLRDEGLFDPSRKKRLPFIPKCVGFITGINSMGVNDVIQNVIRRWGNINFKLEHVTIDGISPTIEIFNSIEKLDNDQEVDVILIARGGGDPQGMLMFNDEKLCRAVAKCKKPVIVAIGHDDDHHIIDDVADFSASTPTDVAKHLVPSHEGEIAEIKKLGTLISNSHLLYIEQETNIINKYLNELPDFNGLINNETLILKNLLNSIYNNITILLNDDEIYLANIDKIINIYMNTNIDSEINNINITFSKIEAFNPEIIFRKGLSQVTINNQVINSINMVKINDQLDIQLKDGQIKTIVKEVK